jgi:CheY-like chemotaxis protein
VVLRVRDTGAGIPPEMLERIFETFTQGQRALDRAPGGLGVGLALVQRLVQLHGGSVTAFSAGVGQGSEFVVRLPRTGPMADSELRIDQQQDARLGTPPVLSKEQPVNPQSSVRLAGAKRILLIEDHPDGREMLQALLRLWGHQVESVANGLQGIEAIRRQRPEVALIDIGLPGLDGYEVARQVRELPGGSQVLLIALTGYGQPDDRRRAFAAGFDAHLVKPVNPEELSKLLAGRGVRTESNEKAESSA